MLIRCLAVICLVAVGLSACQLNTMQTIASWHQLSNQLSNQLSGTPVGKTVYCKSKDGSVYTWDSYLGGLCGELTEITKAEYDRLNNKKTVTARKTATSSHYCKRKDGVVYESKRHTCPRSHTQITKAEYDRLNNKKNVTARKSTTSSRSRQAYCKRDDGSVVAVNRLNLDIPCGPHTEISNAEYDRLKDKKTDTASTTKPDTSSSVDDPLEAKLEKLKKLLEQGLITEEEAAEKRAKLLEDL